MEAVLVREADLSSQHVADLAAESREELLALCGGEQRALDRGQQRNHLHGLGLECRRSPKLPVHLKVQLQVALPENRRLPCRRNLCACVCVCACVCAAPSSRYTSKYSSRLLSPRIEGFHADATWNVFREMCVCVCVCVCVRSQAPRTPQSTAQGCSPRESKASTQTEPGVHFERCVCVCVCMRCQAPRTPQSTAQVCSPRELKASTQTEPVCVRVRVSVCVWMGP